MQTALFQPRAREDRYGLALTDEVQAALALHSPVAIGVSGGKDSSALAFATVEHLDRVGHRGPRVLIHSDLGRVEWKDSAPTCERLSQALGIELVTVRRNAGDMMDRWLTRWSNNVTRYTELSCVKMILPWSTPSMRFCTSELKTAIICRELVRRFPGTTILSACGIRRQESPNRRKAPIAREQAKLRSALHRTRGLDWNAIIEWDLEDVLALHAARAFPLHEAYTVHGSSRVSCGFCIMGSRPDLAAAAGAAEHADLYREMVDLECVSSFAFQSSGWLGDVAPWLLGESVMDLCRAKDVARERERIEAEIPDHLLYTKGWPTCVPTYPEARLISEVRGQIGVLLGIEIHHGSPEMVIRRYEELMAIANLTP